jgi:hypothetical protein
VPIRKFSSQKRNIFSSQKNKQNKSTLKIFASKVSGDLLDKWRFLLNNPDATQHQIRQFELEQEMREMLSEAREIGSEQTEPAAYRGYRRLSNLSDEEPLGGANDNLWSMLNKRRGEGLSSWCLCFWRFVGCRRESHAHFFRAVKACTV